MFIGIDVVDTKIAIGLVNNRGELSFESTFPIDFEQDSEKFVLDLIYVIKSISETIPLELFNDRLLGIGIGIRNTSDKNSGISKLGNGPLQEIIQQYFNIPVFAESFEAAKDLAEPEMGTLKGEINKHGIIAAALFCKDKVKNSSVAVINND